MTVYDNLAGSGAQGLSPNVTRLFVDVLTFGGGYSTGRAAPQNYYHLGLLRMGVQGAYFPTVPIDGASIVLDVPPGVTTLGYSLTPGTSIRVTEAFNTYAPWPLGGVHKSGLYANVNVTPSQGNTLLLSYAVPAGKSALWEAFLAEAGPASLNANLTFTLNSPAGVALYQSFSGVIGSPSTESYYVLSPVQMPLRLNAGEGFQIYALVAAPSGGLNCIASALVLEYSEPVW